MVTTVFKINIKKNTFERRLKYLKRLPELTKKQLREWGTILERDMKESAMNVSVGNIKPFTGKLFGNGIKWHQSRTGNIGELRIVDYGVALDSMRPHYVSVRQDRPHLVSWGLNARSGSIRRKSGMVSRGTMRRFGLLVRPHPYIKNGWSRARPKLKPMLERAVAKTRGK